MSLYGHILRAKNLDRHPRSEQKKILRQLAFAFYVRKGMVPGWVTTLQKLAKLAPPDFKFNPWHDDLGRFTSGPSSYVKPVSDTASENQAPKSWGNPKTLEEHFENHGGDFNAKSPQDYADQANQFFQRAEAGQVQAVRAADNILRAYDPSTNTFGSYNPDGTTRTFLKPTEGAAYFQEQMGYDLSRGGQMIIPPSVESTPAEGSEGGGGGGGGGAVDIFHPHSLLRDRLDDELE